MTDTVYPAMLVAIKTMTGIAAEVGRGFAGIVRQKALADLTSCDYVYRNTKKLLIMKYHKIAIKYQFHNYSNPAKSNSMPATQYKV